MLGKAQSSASSPRMSRSLHSSQPHSDACGPSRSSTAVAASSSASVSAPFSARLNNNARINAPKVQLLLAGAQHLERELRRRRLHPARAVFLPVERALAGADAPRVCRLLARLGVERDERAYRPLRPPQGSHSLVLAPGAPAAVAMPAAVPPDAHLRRQAVDEPLHPERGAQVAGADPAPPAPPDEPHGSRDLRA